MSRLVAVTREVSPTINECELSFVAREPIDVERATNDSSHSLMVGLTSRVTATSRLMRR